MTTDTSYQKQLRAVLLAAIMVVSVVGASVAFTGTAAAQSVGSGLSVDSSDFSDGDREVELVGGTQTIKVEGTFDSVDATSNISYSLKLGNSVGEFVEVSAQGTDRGTTIGISESNGGGNITEVGNHSDSTPSPDFANNGTIGVTSSNQAPVNEITFEVDPSGGTQNLVKGTPKSAPLNNNSASISHTVNVTAEVELNKSISQAVSGAVTLELDNDGGGNDVDASTSTVTVLPDYRYDGTKPAFSGTELVTIGGNVTSAVKGSAGSYELRRVDDYNDNRVITDSSFVEEISSSTSQSDLPATFDTGQAGYSTGDDFISIDTEGLESGDYYLTGQNLRDGQPSQSDTFEIVGQSLSAEFDDDEVTTSGDDSVTALDVSSGRGTYSTNASAGGDLAEEDLLKAFVNNRTVSSSSSEAFNPNDGKSDEFNISLSAGDGNVQIVDPSAAGRTPYANLTVSDYRSLLLQVRAGVTTTEGNLDIDGSESLGSVSGIDNSTSTDSAGSANITNSNNNVVAVDIQHTTFNDLLSPVSNAEINPFDAIPYEADDEEDADEKVVLLENGDLDKDITFDGQDEGDYTFEFDVTDAAATSEASITAVEENVNAEFAEGTSQTPAGDIASFEVTLTDTDKTWVQIGGEDADFVDVLYLEADEQGEPMSVDINTRLLGTNADKDAVFSLGDNVDTLESEVHSSGAITTPSSVDLYEDDGSVGSPNDFDTYVDNIGISTTGSNDGDKQLSRPLQPTDYDVVVASTDVDTALFDADPGGEANNQLASKTIELTQPEINGITTHTAPEETADDTSDVSELVDAATQSETVALDDRLIVQVEASGLYGALVANGSGQASATDFDRLEDGVSTSVLQNVLDNTNETITFEVIAEETTGNQNALEVDLGASDSNTFLVLDEENSQFFLVVDTGSDAAFKNGNAPDEATSFTANMEYDADNDDNRYEFASQANPAPFQVNTGSGGYANYPYLLQGEVVSSEQSLELEPRSITYDNVNDEDVVEAAAGEDAEISATTNVAPGSDAELRLQSTDASSSFRLGNDINISEDGSITTTFDLSGQEVGDEFDVNYRVGGSSTASDSGVLVEAVGTDDGEETNETDTDDGETTDDGEEMDDGETDETTDDGESTDDGTPGFGAVVALIALIGAALLAVRRQN